MTKLELKSISAAAAIMGRKGGKIGGKSRSSAKVEAGRRNIKLATASLTPEQRRERAIKASKAAAIARQAKAAERKAAITNAAKEREPSPTNQP